MYLLQNVLYVGAFPGPRFCYLSDIFYCMVERRPRAAMAFLQDKNKDKEFSAQIIFFFLKKKKPKNFFLKNFYGMADHPKAFGGWLPPPPFWSLG
jgi:hypothetical protein